MLHCCVLVLNMFIDFKCERKVVYGPVVKKYQEKDAGGFKGAVGSIWKMPTIGGVQDPMKGIAHRDHGSRGGPCAEDNEFREGMRRKVKDVNVLELARRILKKREAVEAVLTC